MRSTTPLVLLWTLGACGSCGGTQVPSSDRAPVPVTFTVHNATDAPLYLPSQSDCEFGVLSIEGLAIYGGQTVSCEEARTGPCPDFGDCGAPGVRRLMPGERWTIPWSGQAYEMTSLEADERGENCPTECAAWGAPEPGPRSVTVEAYADCGAGPCNCAPDSEYCTPAYQHPPELRAEARFTLPEQSSTPIEVVVAFEQPHL